MKKTLGLKALLEDKNYWAKLEAEMALKSEEIAASRKDAVLHLRMNSRDLVRLKEKAAQAGMKYQPFIASILRQAAQNI
jgi:predicted DNA binding CopG/RHH family protein